VPGVRQFLLIGSVEYFENGAGQVESRQQTGQLIVDRENSDQLSIEGGANYELLARNFRVARNSTIPTGGYNFNDITARYTFGQQRRASGTVAWQAGQFYDGHISALSYTAARVAVTKRLSLEPSVSINRVTRPADPFTTSILRARTDYAFTPRMFASTLLQFSSDDETFSSNIRFRWEYLPGSELFVVYTDERDTVRPGYPELRNRAVVVKINRLFRF
jgi:hypothetical protein